MLTSSCQNSHNSCMWIGSFFMWTQSTVEIFLYHQFFHTKNAHWNLWTETQPIAIASVSWWQVNLELQIWNMFDFYDLWYDRKKNLIYPNWLLAVRLQHRPINSSSVQPAKIRHFFFQPQSAQSNLALQLGSLIFNSGS